MINEKGPQFNTVETGIPSAEISSSYEGSQVEAPVLQSASIPVSENGLQKTLPTNTPIAAKESRDREDINLSSMKASDGGSWNVLVGSKKQGEDIPA